MMAAAMMDDGDTAWLEAVIDLDLRAGMSSAMERVMGDDILTRLWTEHVERPGSPPTFEALATFDPPEDVRHEAGRLMTELWAADKGADTAVREFRRLVAIEQPYMVVFEVELSAQIRGLVPREMLFAISLQEMREKYMDRERGRKPFPLTPVLATFPLPIEAGRHPRPIVPAAFVTDRQSPLFHLPTPEIPGPAPGRPAYLPGLEPEAPPTPALILAMFDDAGGASLTQNGRVSASASIWLEAMLDVPIDARDGHLRETRYRIGEIVGDWLGWKLKHYRPTGKYTGQQLARALRDVRDLWVPMSGGGYFPVMVSAWSGWGLDDRLGFVVRLPRGQVGPQVDRVLLRRLRDSGPAYRMYLSLCFEWDKYGARNGRLILPTRPEVRRAPGGQIVDAQGRVLTGKGNRPVYSLHDPRAIRTGAREPNPAASTRYPMYTPDDRVALAFPAQVFKDKHVRREMRRRADKAVARLKCEGIVVEREGHYWRIMPPDLPELPALPPAGDL